MTDTNRSAPLLEVRDLSIVFDTRRGPLTAVDRISFSLAPGEILGVVGESGAGKSLTGTAIIGLLERPGRIGGGEIRFEGNRIDNLPPERMRRLRGRKIGVIFQDPLTSLNPLFTVGRQLVETIQTHLDLGREQARRRALELLAEVGIPAPEQRIDHYPHQFSGGMRQRVVIALALCANPKLVIADEPTTALDVSIQAQILALLKTLCREHGAAVILITHDMGVIAETADRVAVMYAGRIAEIGPVTQVVEGAAAPLHRRADGLDPGDRHRRRAPDPDRGVDAPAERYPGRLRLPPALPAGAGRLRGRPPEPRPVGRWQGRLRALRRRRRMTAISEPLVSMQGLKKHFDVSAPWLNRVLERKPRLHLRAVRRARPRYPARHNLQPRGRVRLRQVHGRAAGRRALCADIRHDPLRGHRPDRPARRRPAADPAPDADDLPGPLCQPQPALAGARHHRRATAELRPAGRPRSGGARGRAAAGAGGAERRRTARSSRTNSPAASASASRSHGRSRRTRTSWSATSRPRRSMCRCRRRS